MNRKLQHTIQALAASAAVFSLMLIAGGPAPLPAPPPVAIPAALLMASAEAAGTTVDALEGDRAPDAETARSSNRSHRRGHATTALPYFSFAQGLRRVTGS